MEVTVKAEPKIVMEREENGEGCAKFSFSRELQR